MSNYTGKQEAEKNMKQRLLWEAMRYDSTEEYVSIQIYVKHFESFSYY